VTSRIKLRRELEATDAQSDTLDELDKLASSLQDTAMDMRLIPFSQVSDSFRGSSATSRETWASGSTSDRG